jgi:choline dehydrogenase
MRRQSNRTSWGPTAISKQRFAARELVSQKAFDGIREAELIPGPKTRSKADLIEFVRMGTMSFGHPIGTARMGEGTDAVVDSELRVHGVRGLRVADASVMPSIVSGATNAASIMIGGRTAEFIKSSR